MQNNLKPSKNEKINKQNEEEIVENFEKNFLNLLYNFKIERNQNTRAKKTVKTILYISKRSKIK